MVFIDVAALLTVIATVIPALLTAGVSFSFWLGPIWITLSSGATVTIFLAPLIALFGLLK